MLLDSEKVSSEIKEKLKNKVKSYLIKPCLAVIQIGHNKMSDAYIKLEEQACNEVGIYFKYIQFEETAKEREIINRMIELNNDEYVHGILIQLPIPERFNAQKLLNLIHRNKDVNGLITDNGVAKNTSDITSVSNGSELITVVMFLENTIQNYEKL